MNILLVNRLSEAEKYFRHTRFHSIVAEAVQAFNSGNESAAVEALDRLPTWESLLKELMCKLHGKSVLKTVKRIAEGSTENKWEKMKGIFSLATHACIECEKGNLEYRLVLVKLYEKLGADVFTT